MCCRQKGPEGAAERVAQIEAKLAEDLDTLRQYREAVREANIPQVLDEDAAGILVDIAKRAFIDPDGNEQTYITPEELHFLSIKRGTLDEAERKEIESHVMHSFDFLINIP